MEMIYKSHHYFWYIFETSSICAKKDKILQSIIDVSLNQKTKTAFALKRPLTSICTFHSNPIGTEVTCYESLSFSCSRASFWCCDSTDIGSGSSGSGLICLHSVAFVMMHVAFLSACFSPSFNGLVLSDVGLWSRQSLSGIHHYTNGPIHLPCTCTIFLSNQDHFGARISNLFISCTDRTFIIESRLRSSYWCLAFAYYCEIYLPFSFSLGDSVLSGLTKCIHRLSKVREPPSQRERDDSVV